MFDMTDPPAMDAPEFLQWLDHAGMRREDGTLDETEVLKNLTDFYWLIEEVGKVYCSVTGNHISKPMTRGFEVERLVEERIESAAQAESERWVQRATDVAREIAAVTRYYGWSAADYDALPAPVRALFTAQMRLQQVLDDEDEPDDLPPWPVLGAVTHEA